MFENTEFLTAVGFCLFMLVLALIFQKFPPKKINMLYGYRTTRSMKNEIVWLAANRYASSLFVKITLTSFVLPFIGYFLFPEFIFPITVFGQLFLIILLIPLTENYLRKHFDKDGNPL